MEDVAGKKSVNYLTSAGFVAMWRNRTNTLYARFAEASTQQTQAK